MAMVLSILGVAGALFALMFFFVEPRANVSSVGQAAWWAAATLSAVGYGDICPETTGVHAIACILAVMGRLASAGLVGACACGFNQAAMNPEQIQPIGAAMP